MKKQISVLLFLFAFVFSISAQEPSDVESNLRANVGYLASDALDGRRTGESGATVAAGYVANMFANYKLEQGVVETDAKGKKRTNFLQKFPFISGVELGAGNVFSMNNAAVNIKNDWMPVGFSPNGNIANSEIVFAGFGIASDELKYDDYAGLDVRNNIVAVFAGTPDAGNPHSEFGRFNIHAKANIAKSKGAVALLIISGEEKFADEKAAKLEFNQTLGETAIPAFIVSSETGAKILNAKTAKEVLETEKWLSGKPANAQVRFANLPKQTASITVDLVQKQSEAYNVVGIIEGRDKILKNEAIVIGAHYDHLGRGGDGSLAVNSKEIHHGADDNASGVSAMLELARQFRKEKNNKRTIIFIAFGGEEEGLLGSKYYVNNPVFPLDKTVAMINMDMVGRLKEDKLTVGGIGTANEWKQKLAALNDKSALNWVKPEKQTGDFQRTGTISNEDATKLVKDEKAIPVRGEGELIAVAIKNYLFDLQLNQDGFGPSDHSSFYGKKIPVLFFFTGTHTDYHKPTDTAEKINYQGLEKITEFVGAIVRSIDQNPKRPTYTVAQSSGMMGGRRGFNVSLGTVPSYADNTNDGLLLDGVRDDSAAAKAGIKAGDKIIKMVGRDVKNISDYVFLLGEMKAGEEYEIVVMRGAEKLMLKIVPDARK